MKVLSCCKIAILLLVLFSLEDRIVRCDLKEAKCKPVYVRWPRVRLSAKSAKQGALSQTACRNACTNNRDPMKSSFSLQCSAFNHRAGISGYDHECHIFQKDSVQHTDGYVEADDRFNFFWKYCIDTEVTCAGDYAFTYLSDRYIATNEVAKTTFTKSLEECLGECLNENQILCRSISFNRTDGGCHISEQNQISKPASIRVNNNPNFRIDYYENNCANNSFIFTKTCEESGIRIRVKSKVPYTGALYGAYDYFSCRIEPYDSRNFEYFFPYPGVSKNCSDSMRETGAEMVLESVLSTDGVEPLYFITSDDLTYQARCPAQNLAESKNDKYKAKDEENELFNKNSSRYGTSVQEILDALEAGERKDKEKVEEINYKSQGSGKSVTSYYHFHTPRSNTKDTFSLTPYIATSTPANSNNEGIDEGQASLASIQPTTMIAIQNNYLNENKFNNDEKYEKERTSLTSPTSKLNSSTSSTKRSTPGLEAINDFIRYTSVESVQDSHSTTTPKSSSVDQPKDLPISSMNTSILIGKKKPMLDEDDAHLLNRSPPNTETTRNFSFSTHLSFPENGILMRTESGNRNEGHADSDRNFMQGTPIGTSSTTSTMPPSVQTTTPPSTSSVATPPFRETLTPKISSQLNSSDSHPVGSTQQHYQGSKKPNEKIIFDIFHNGQPAEAVVVGSRITLSFTPFYAIPPAYMSISGCEVEPIGSLYEWEKEPLGIIKEGCQADNVGLVCPPQLTDYGIRVTAEAFRYQTTTQVQYKCLIRVCPFAACNQNTCPVVEGCPGDDLIARSFGFSKRAKRTQELTLEQIKAALAANPHLQQQLGLVTPSSSPTRSTTNDAHHVHMNASLQQQLIYLGGDTIVRRRLIVVNSEDELRYYVKTGEIPQGHFN